MNTRNRSKNRTEDFDSLEICSIAQPIKSRQIEMKLRDEISNLKKELQTAKSESVNWRRKCEKSFKKHRVTKRLLKTKTNSLKHSEHFLDQLKQNFSQLRIKEHKKVFATTVKASMTKKNFPKKQCKLLPNHYYENRTHNYSKSQRIAIIKRNVTSFFLKDENSSLAPGVHETITKKKNKVRKRYLSDSIRNLHRKFVKETDNTISRASFYRFKPFWVVKPNVSSRDTCLCKEHCNFKYMIEALYHYKIIKEKNVQLFLESICCDVANKKCMFGECEICKERHVLSSDSNEIVQYKNWISESIERPGAKGLMYNVKETKIKQIVCTTSILIEAFNEKLRHFLVHSFTCTHQFKFFEFIKKNLEKNQVYLVIDFSQNYFCKYNREVQAVHFGASQKQISLQTGGFYYKNDVNEIQFESISVMSDCLRHDAGAVWALLYPMFDRIRELIPQIEIVHIQSDGPTTQYKNKTNFFLFNYFCKKYHFKSASWNYWRHYKTTM